MPIENNLVENVVKSAIRNLQSKTFGGVSKESAQNAIKDTAQEVQNIANEEIYQVQRELNSVRNRSLDEIVQLTSDKDRLEISLKKTKTELDKTAKELSEVSNELRKAISTKAGKEKVLPNGHIQTTKVNRNGATMTVETLPNEQRTPILYEVTNIDGYKRRTKINPVDGKPINTFTDTHGEYLYEYLPNGAKIRKVNVKKVKTKPQVVKREVLVDNCHMCEVRESYSDGSYKTINYNPNNRKISKEVMYDNNNKVLYEIETKGENKKTLVYYPETGNLKEKIFKETTDQNITIEMRYKYDEKGRTLYASKEKNGMKTEQKTVIDEFGLPNTRYRNVKYTYPETSQIKTSKFVIDDYSIKNEVLKLKNGDIVEIKINPNYWNPMRATIRTKDSEKALNYDETREFLKSIGYRNSFEIGVDEYFRLL